MRLVLDRAGLGAAGEYILLKSEEREVGQVVLLISLYFCLIFQSLYSHSKNNLSVPQR